MYPCSPSSPCYDRTISRYSATLTVLSLLSPCNFDLVRFLPFPRTEGRLPFRKCARLARNAILGPSVLASWFLPDHIYWLPSRTRAQPALRDQFRMSREVCCAVECRSVQERKPPVVLFWFIKILLDLRHGKVMLRAMAGPRWTRWFCAWTISRPSSFRREIVAKAGEFVHYDFAVVVGAGH